MTDEQIKKLTELKMRREELAKSLDYLPLNPYDKEIILNNKQKGLQNKINEVTNASVFSIDEIGPILATLVSLVEGEEYSFHLIGDSNFTNFMNYEVLLFLCKTENFNQVYNKLMNIDSEYHQLISLHEQEEYRKAIFNIPNEDYIQLAHISHGKYVDGNKSIEYVGLKGTNEYQEYPLNHVFHLVDDRFSYILDFINYLTNQKFLKPDLKLSVEEMQSSAIVFAENILSNKNGRSL